MGIHGAHLIPLYPPKTVRSVCWVVFLLDITRACKSVNMPFISSSSDEPSEQTICQGIPAAGALLL